VGSDPRTWPFRYELLDGLRGLAALIVVLHHLSITTLGHYAVMLFFVISGYCIAAATETARRKELGFGSFMWRRLHRIYPPYLLAIVFYVVTRLLKVALQGPNDLTQPWLVWLQNLTLTQWLTLPFHPVADAPQNPALLISAFWSLNYEDQFYLIMAAALFLATRLRVPMLVPVSALAVAGLVWNWWVPGGWICGFFIEYWVHFAIGVLLFHALCLSASRWFRPGFVLTILALGIYSATQIFPWYPQTPLTLRAYTELFVTCGFTLFLYFARPLSESVCRLQLWRPFAALGLISYSLYLINQFNLRLVTEVAGRLVPHVTAALQLTLMVVLQVSIAGVFWYFCERPFLNRMSRTVARPAPMAATEGAR
jgi:peptidoglycan/LPS O-acetylase OafA/YrhL